MLLVVANVAPLSFPSGGADGGLLEGGPAGEDGDHHGVNQGELKEERRVD